MADEDSHSANSSVSGEEGHSDPLRVAAEAGARLSTPFGLIEDKIISKAGYAQNCTKILRNLTFVVQFAYFCIRPNKGREQQKKLFVFLSNFRATF